MDGPSASTPSGPPHSPYPSAASELVAVLADEGVSHLFINPGTDTAPVQEALAAARASGSPHPRAVLCTHEFVALSSAIGHHFVTGAPQAVMVHVDAGTLNLGSALHNAQRNRVPAVVFAGRSPYSVSADIPGHRDSPIHWQQEQLDQQAVVRAFGKWTKEVPRGRDLGWIVRRAFQVARTDPQGLSYVMLPREALMEGGGGTATSRLRNPRPAVPDPDSLAELALYLADADNPVIVTGRTGAKPAAVTSLVKLAELLGCAVIDHHDRLNFPPRHALYAGETSKLLENADVVLLLDVEVPWVPAHVTPPPGAVVLQIDRDCVKADMPSWVYPVALSVEADTSAALPLLVGEVQGLGTRERTARWSARRQEVTRRLSRVRQGWQAEAEASDAESAADAMLASLNGALPGDAIVLSEPVTNSGAVARQIVRDPGQFFRTGSPALGWAVAGALGVKLGRPESSVIAICGDGAFNFGVPTAALWSAHKAGAPFISVILDNHAYHASKLPVQRLYPGGAADAEGSFPETDLAPAPDYVQLARAYGGDGLVVTQPEDVPMALRHCLKLQAENRCSVIDIKLPAA